MTPFGCYRHILDNLQPSLQDAQVGLHSYTKEKWGKRAIFWWRNATGNSLYQLDLDRRLHNKGKLRDQYKMCVQKKRVTSSANEEEFEVLVVCILWTYFKKAAEKWGIIQTYKGDQHI